MSIASLLNALGGSAHTPECDHDHEMREYGLRVAFAREIIIHSSTSVDVGDPKPTATEIVDAAWEIADTFYSKVKKIWQDGEAEREEKRARYKKAQEAHASTMIESVKEATLPTDDVRSFRHLSGQVFKIVLRTHSCWEQDTETGELGGERDFVHIYVFIRGELQPLVMVAGQHFETTEDALSTLSSMGFTQLAKNVDDAVVH